jgi:hypothetical protein
MVHFVGGLVHALTPMQNGTVRPGKLGTTPHPQVQLYKWTKDNILSSSQLRSQENLLLVLTHMRYVVIKVEVAIEQLGRV